jgi:hypothetical protein
MVLASGPPDSDKSDEYHLWSIGGDDGRDDAKAVGKSDAIVSHMSSGWLSCGGDS